MRNPILTLFATAAALTCAGCSDSNGPAAGLAGTWHVAVGPIGSGNLSPNSFDVVVTQGANNSFHFTVPAITWSIGPVVYDSTPTLATFSDTTYWGFRIAPSTATQHCDALLFSGQRNAGQDTLMSGSVQVFHSDTLAGGFCAPQADGSITAHK